MSIQTTLARADARDRERRWKDHRSGCPQCVTAQRSRKPDRMCDDGLELYELRREALEELEWNRYLDRQPMPGQATLF